LSVEIEKLIALQRPVILLDLVPALRENPIPANSLPSLRGFDRSKQGGSSLASILVSLGVSDTDVLTSSGDRIDSMTWKTTLYDSYISTGQAGELGKNADEQFRPRAFYLRKVIRKFFPHQRNARILDIGCGHGALLYFLHQAGYENVCGVDTSPEQVDFAERLGIKGVEAGDAMEFLRRQSPGSANVICLFDVLEHLDRQELFDMLGQVRRVLAPGGRCIGHVPNAGGLFGMHIRYGDLTHELAFTSASLRQLFRAFAFSDIQCFEDKPEPHGLKSIVRRILWDLGSIPLRLLSAAETGELGNSILSRNLIFVAE